MVIWLSAAVSADGYLDDAGPERLVLSDPQDWAEVRALRARCQAILVGAETVRRDNPALVTRDEALRKQRIGAGMTPDPVKVTVTRSGELDPESRFFTEGEAEKIVICTSRTSAERLALLGKVATVLVAPGEITDREIVRLLEERGIASLFVEGGSHMLTLFLSGGLVDRFRLAVAPFFVGDPEAPRLTGSAAFHFDKRQRMHVLGVRQVGDMAVMEYSQKYSAEDYRLLGEAIALADLCPPSGTAYSVGAVVVTRVGNRYTGYSRETAANNHAEEEAILKAQRAGDPLEGARIYSSMEPCTSRKSKEQSCSSLIIRNGIGRAVFAAYEPANFVRCEGERMLREAGVNVTVIGELAAAALAPNAHILNRQG